MPDAVYDLSYPARARFQDRLRECGVQVFNRTTRFNKWKIHQMLKGESDIGTHLPETDLLRDYQSLNQALQRHKSVYLKPVSGSRGMGIIKIHQYGKAQYKCFFRR
ncbi:MAG: YheC/YheD family protein [Syntrophothermus sp.]